MNKCDYEGEVNIYAHEELIEIIHDIAKMLLQKNQTRFINDRIHLIPVSDGDIKMILGHEVVFFDIQSNKAKQFGFTMDLGAGEKLACCGDEPYNEANFDHVNGSSWLLHEAFCLHSQADIFKPYEKHHSTVKDACEIAMQLGIKNLLLYHTEDRNIANRKQMYKEEGTRYFTGNLFVPDDLEKMEL